MANLIKLRRSAVQGAVPTTSQLELGELAMNTYDGKLFLKRDDGLAQYIVEVGGNVGFEIKNQTGSTIPKGTVVKFAGTLGASGRLLAAPFLANGTDPSEYVVGIVENDIPDGADGFAIDHGKIFNLNTSAFAQGTILYASSTVAGGFTATRPAAPNNKVTVAAVIHSSTTAGILEVRVTIGSSIENDELVELASLANNDTLVYDSTDGRFENRASTGSGNNVLATSPTLVTPNLGTPSVATLTNATGLPIEAGTTGTLGVSRGGTGATTLTANNIILGNGTSAVQFVAPGTSGNVLTSNGTTWTSAAAGASLLGDTDSASPFETSLGFEAGLNTTGTENTFIGYQTGKANTSGQKNTALGFHGLDANTTGVNNVAVGVGSLTELTTGTDNVAIGFRTLFQSAVGRYNVAIGSEATGSGVTTGEYNIAIGRQTGNAFTSGGNNTALGRIALASTTTGSSNVAIGERAAFSNTTGSSNIAIGQDALYKNITQTGNVAVGFYALAESTTGTQNVSVGYEAGDKITTGTQNTVLGRGAGSSGTNDLTTGSNNIILGYNAAASSSTVSNETTIGNSSTTSARIFGDVKFNNSYTETVFTVTDGATVNLDPNNGSIQTWTLGASRTPGQANWAAGQSITLMIDDGTAFAITWSTLGVVWETNAGSAPTLATTGFTVIVLWKVGTTIYGARVGDA